LSDPKVEKPREVEESFETWVNHNQLTHWLVVAIALPLLHDKHYSVDTISNNTVDMIIQMSMISKSVQNVQHFSYL
jgi:hypothetical protein